MHTKAYFSAIHGYSVHSILKKKIKIGKPKTPDKLNQNPSWFIKLPKGKTN